MITYIQSIILGLLQGATELFPISSLGHSIILPRLLGWNINQQDNYFLIFLVATHLATSLVLFGFFFKDWVLIIKGIFRSLSNRVIDPHDTYEKLGWLIVVATIPAGLLGVLFEEKIKILFGSPSAAALFIFLNGLVLFGAEYLSSTKKARLSTKSEQSDSTHVDAAVARLSWSQSVKIGFGQALALIPGFSRTGATLGAGLAVELDHESAARFAFLLATPIIFAAATLELPSLAFSSTYSLGPILVGALSSAAAAYLSVRFLTKYFKKNTLIPFAWYCTIVGLVTTILFL